MKELDENLSLSNGPPTQLSVLQKVSTFIGLFGLFVLLLATLNIDFPKKIIWLSISLIAITLGVFGFSYGLYANKSAGIKNNSVWSYSLTSRGLWAWLSGIVLTGFYIVLYFFPTYLGYNPDGSNSGLITLFDPLSIALSKNTASQWFVYGTLYTLAILVFGVKFIWKYRNNPYQRIRTFSVMFFNWALPLLLPNLLLRLITKTLIFRITILKNFSHLILTTFKDNV